MSRMNIFIRALVLLLFIYVCSTGNFPNISKTERSHNLAIRRLKCSYEIRPPPQTKTEQQNHEKTDRLGERIDVTKMIWRLTAQSEMFL